MISLVLLHVGCVSAELPAHLGLNATIITASPGPGSVALIAGGNATVLWVDGGDWEGVLRAARDLRTDVERVSGVLPAYSENNASAPPGPVAVIVGTVGRSRLVDAMVAAGKVDVADIKGKWENFVIATVEDPLPGVRQAVVVAGSDKRGTIFGVYELSEQLGVSPWYWWADVPPKNVSTAYVVSGRFPSGTPRIKYRGIFLNDEAPALIGWTNLKYGGRNHLFYTQVFELLLRLRANYLWPAMWDDAFSEDDPLNCILADRYGVVMATSHQEPMMASTSSWNRNAAKYGNGEWNYTTNAAGLREFWTDSFTAHKRFENVVSMAMRGNGDEALSSDPNVTLLEEIVAAQRAIIANATGAPAAERPQFWALYKEVQQYYEDGMTVPDDVTLLWSDDNWGNLRRMPAANSSRPGGSGVYYHFDYVGAPHSYRWINTNPLPRIQEQMANAAAYGADRIWVVNVGDLKPMEAPIEFFMRFAWDPDRWPAGKVADYLRVWANREFGGGAPAAEAAELVAAYAKYNHWRKPEILATDTFSVTNYGESQRVINLWGDLRRRADDLYAQFPVGANDHVYQLVVHPIRAAANLNEFYASGALNELYEAQRRASTNKLANRARLAFKRDDELTQYWNSGLAGGKWCHLMDQPHIGSSSGWDTPTINTLPWLRSFIPPNTSAVGVVLEGSETPLAGGGTGDLPPLSSEGGPASRYLEVFRLGTGNATYAAAANQSWVAIVNASGVLGDDVRVVASVADWAALPVGQSFAAITVRSATDQWTVRLLVVKVPPPPASAPFGFLDVDGYLAIEAPHADRAVGANGISWALRPDLGRGPGAYSLLPLAFAPVAPTPATARLEFDVYLSAAGTVTVQLVVSPTLNFVSGGAPLRVGVSFDAAAARVVAFGGTYQDSTWSESVTASVRRVSAALPVAAAGFHTLKVWAVDPGLVLQRVEIDTGRLLPSYLGPPESPRGQ
eukprot:gene9052-14015_t